MINRVILITVALFMSLTVNGEGMSIQEHPRYGENPVYLFFESYILDVIGYLPEERSESIQKLNLQKTFKTQASEWREALKETLHLSETIDIAILDLWYRNRDKFRSENGEYDPLWFSQIFADEYMKEGSQVDVWPSGALIAAKDRIKEAEAAK